MIRKFTLGQRIRQHRKAKGMTLHELSALSGVSKGALSKLENKPSNAGLETLEKIAKALKTTVSELIKNNRK